jgi:putative aldouronate transport system permease protein
MSIPRPVVRFAGSGPAETLPTQERIKLGWKRWARNNGAPIMMSLPAVLVIFVFAYLPMFGIIIAFKEYRFDKGIFGSDWIGLTNFKFLFGSDVAWRITRNTLVMNLLFIITGTITNIVVALLMNEVQGKLRAKFYQSFMFLPHFLSWVVVGYFAFAFLSLDGGILNKVLASFGAETVAWYREPDSWPAILVIVTLWKGVGYGSLFYLAIMLGISPEFYEAAKIDGAGKLQQIWYITMPQLVPVIIILVLFAVSGIFRADFGLFFNVTRDQATLYPTTDVIDTFVYRALRQMNDLGMSAAAGVYQSVVGFFLVLTVNWVIRRIDPDKALF